jgi:hypothetical protein
MIRLLLSLEKRKWRDINAGKLENNEWPSMVDYVMDTSLENKVINFMI